MDISFLVLKANKESGVEKVNKFTQILRFVIHSKMVVPVVMIVVCIVTFTMQTTVTYAEAGCANSTVEATIPQDNVPKMIEEINIRRAELGISPMKLSQDLIDSALYHAVDMQEDNYFERATYDRDANGELVKQCGVYKRIENFYGEISHAAEMISTGGYGSDEDAINTLLNTLAQIGQYDKLMEDIAWEFGMGYAEDNVNPTEKWVLTVGRRNTVFPMIINHEQAETDTQEVELYMYGEWNTFRLQNNNGDWSQWYTFDNETNTIEWTLDEFAGSQTVVIEVMAADWSTYSISDSIIYNPYMSLGVPLAVGLNGVSDSAENDVNSVIMMATLFATVGTLVAYSRKTSTRTVK